MKNSRLWLAAALLSAALGAQAQDSGGYQVEQSVGFARNSAKLSNQAQAQLRAEMEKLALLLRYRPESSVEIAGYSESGEKQPGVLADARAQKVWEFLISLGLPAERMEPVGYGAPPGTQSKSHVEIRIGAEDAQALSQFAPPVAAAPQAPAPVPAPVPAPPSVASTPESAPAAPAEVPAPAAHGSPTEVAPKTPAPAAPSAAAASSGTGFYPTQPPSTPTAPQVASSPAPSPAAAAASAPPAAAPAAPSAPAPSVAATPSAPAPMPSAASPAAAPSHHETSAQKQALEREEARIQREQNLRERERIQAEAAAEKKRQQEEAHLKAAQNAAEKKRLADEAAAEKKRQQQEAAAERKRKAEEAAAERARRHEEAVRLAAEKKRQQEEAAAEKKRQQQEAAAERKRKQEEAAAERKRKAEEAAAERARRREEAVRLAAEKKKQEEQAAIQAAMAQPLALPPKAVVGTVKLEENKEIKDNQLSSSYTRPQHPAPTPSALPGETAYFIQGTAYFSTNSRTLTPGSSGMLDTTAERLKRTLQAHPGMRVDVVGHADPLLESSQADVLSEGRAETLVDELVARGVDRSRLRALGAADTQPLTSKKNDPARNLNMRAEIRVPNS